VDDRDADDAGDVDEAGGFDAVGERTGRSSAMDCTPGIEGVLDVPAVDGVPADGRGREDAFGACWPLPPLSAASSVPGIAACPWFA
jgi:hypothetical protein